MLIHSFVEKSNVNGPGNRFVLWTQGCTKKCKNCFNPETWDFRGNQFAVDFILEKIKQSNCDGVTITGGDPLEQADELFDLLFRVHNLDFPKGVILFTGYTLDEIYELNGKEKDCLKYIDVLIDGKYNENLKINESLRGSYNQKFHFFSDKIKKNEVEIDQSIEIGFQNDFIYITGFPILNRKNLLKKGLKFG